MQTKITNATQNEKLKIKYETEITRWYARQKLNKIKWFAGKDG